MGGDDFGVWRANLPEVARQLWALLGRGAADRRHGFHTPTVATIGRDGRPRARVVVLRAVDPRAATLRFHTDARTPKFAELEADPRLALTLYDAGAKTQIRIEGEAELHRTGDVADHAWAASQPMSRVCYGTVPAPGEAIENADQFTLPGDPDAVAAGRAHFAAVVVRVAVLEGLHLAHGANRRAVFRAPDFTGEWLVP